MIQTILFILVSAQSATLDEAFRSALQKNETVLQSREKIVQAEEQYNIAKSAPFPTLSYEYEYIWQDLPTNPLARAFSPERQSSSFVRLRQPIFRGLREWSVLRQREDLVDAGREERVNTMLALYQAVATSYLSVLAIEQDLKNLNELAQIYGARVREYQGRAKRGESATHEVLTMQSNEAATLSEISLVNANLQSERQNLNFLTGLPADVPVTEAEDKSGPLQPLGEYLARIEQRPDIKAARAKLAAAKEQVSFSKGAHWPSVDLIGNYYFQRPSFFDQIDWDVKVNLSLPIFEGGMRVAETRESSSKEREATLELARARRKADADIRSYYDRMRLREGQLIALKKSSELSYKTYQTLQRESRRGLVRNIEVQVALTNYGNSRRTYDQARFDARLDRIKLESAALILPASLEGSLK